jgi:ethanolamine utilization protein EutN
MMLARVIGHVVCSVKDRMYEGEKILVVQPVDPAGQSAGPSFLAVDAVQAGIGDQVLVIDEGGSAREVLGKPGMGTIRTVIAGIVDAVESSE